MRRSALLLAVLVAGCGKTDTLGTSPTDAVVRTATFDPESPENTLAWAVGLYVKMGEAPKGNEIAAAAFWKKYQEEANKECAGKTIRWKFPVERVSYDGDISFTPIQVMPPAGLETDQPKVFRLSLSPHFEPGDRSLRGFVFPTRPLKADWLKTVRPGDRLAVVGTISAGGGVYIERDSNGDAFGRTSFSVKDGRVEAP